MAKVVVSSLVSILFTASFWVSSNGATYNYNVVSLGAKADGKSDSTRAFLKAWARACNSGGAAAVMVVPKGRFLLKAVVFKGPCKTKKIHVRIDGTLLAPSTYIANSGYWILFLKVNGVTLIGGSLDARGPTFWACRRSRTSHRNCPVGARSITFNWANNIVISGLTSINSQLSHLVINSCNNVMVRSVKIMAPDQSPNTDGIHVQGSTGVTIAGTSIRTGDDCISIGPGTRNLWMERIQCGPGHGVSIGSLAKEMNEEGVENVTLTNSIFSGSDNGVRIKSWARPSKGFVRGIAFRNILMRNVQYPIIVDQNYCPNNQGCPGQSSGVKISEVTYKNIQGSSATQVAVVFDCSPSNPCKGIRLQDIKLTYLNKPAKASCKHVRGTYKGVMVPPSCF